MKRLFALASLLCFLLGVSAHADTLLNSYRLAANPASRPVLQSSAVNFSQTNNDNITVAFTPPASTTLLVAYIGLAGDGDSSRALNTLTFNGTPLTQATSFAQSGSRIISGIAYRISPTTGVSQNLVVTIDGANWETIFIQVWYFSNVNIVTPIGSTANSSSTSAQQLTQNVVPSYALPYIVAGSTSRRSSGSGSCYTATNLTIVNQNAESSDAHAMASASNNTLTSAGSTAFTMKCSWTSGYVAQDLVEVKGP